MNRLEMNELQTSRLLIERFTESDAGFIVELLNDPGWLRFIGDKKVRTLDDARQYLHAGPLAMYEERGFGLCRVSRRADGLALGMCGLLKRDGLDDIELGFAFLPEGRGQGYAREAAAAVIEFGFESLAAPRIVAITNSENAASARVLEGVGMHFDRVVSLPPEGREVRLYAIEADRAGA
ncbi:MAG: GNAT family N-acetyltransferase [Burkholderiaceae bacterium]